MFLSKYFLPTTKDNPSEATIVSHKLMLRAGMIKQLTSGIYEWLPMGLKVLQNISEVVRKEMNKSEAIEVLLPSIQPIFLWEKSGRYGKESELQSEMLLMSDRHNNGLLFCPTAEEAICHMVANSVQSYKNLPINLYQIGWKFRDEIRPKYGVMRGREFLMKDAYSFDLSEEESLKSYDKMLKTYFRIFKKMDLTAIPVTADTGDIGGNYSHEFHVLANTGESTIYYDKKIIEASESDDFDINSLDKFYAMDSAKHNPYNSPKNLEASKSIEVGHLFYLGDKYSTSMGVRVQNVDGTLLAPKMGCYGVGISRLVGAIIECHHDDKGIIWPMAVAPFNCVIANLMINDNNCNEIAQNIYKQLTATGIDVLYDDTNDGAGVKFNRMDLIGIPIQLIIGKVTIENGEVEIKMRNNGEKFKINKDEVVTYCLELIKKFN